MIRTSKIQHFDTEGRQNLPNVIKNVKNYLKALRADGLANPAKIIFFTGQGEGPMLAYSQLAGLDVTIIAVTFPPTFLIRSSESRFFKPEIPARVRKFFAGVEIEVISGRLPFDDIGGAESHNSAMSMLKAALSIFGGSTPLAVQAVLQACDFGLVAIGEEVIAVTSDTALVVTAATTKDFLSKAHGLVVNEIICKPRNFNVSRPTLYIETADGPSTSSNE